MFGANHAPVEIQAKHGLTAGRKLLDAVFAVGDRSKKDMTTQVVFVVDRHSKAVYRDFAKDLNRIRSGRTDGLKADAKRLAEESSGDFALLERLYVVPLDLDHAHDEDLKWAVQRLGSVLDEPERAQAAWAALVSDAAEVCATRLRRTRTELVKLLGGASRFGCQRQTSA